MDTTSLNFPSQGASILWDTKFLSKQRMDSSESTSSPLHSRMVSADEDGRREEDGASCYLCTHCGKGYDSEHELDEHFSRVHQENGGQNHQNSNGQQKESGEDEDEFMDDLDDEEVFTDKIQSGAAVQSGDHSTRTSTTVESPTAPALSMDEIHPNRRAYSCKFCSKVFDSNSALNVHYTHTHRDKPQYECDFCGRVFGVKRELATHRRSHEGQPTHRCRQCGKEFGTKQLLRKHELWHTGERSHVCPQCGKAFFQKGHLTQHMMIHAGGRPHACHLCQKTFIFKFDLNRHMKIHAERVGNSEESPNADTSNDLKLANYETSRGDVGTPAGGDSNDQMETSRVQSTPFLDSLFPLGSATSALPVIQQLHQQNSGNEVLGAGANPFGGLLRNWTSSGYLDNPNGMDPQQRAALAAAFAQALCQAQQQASIFAGFTASSPPLSQLFLDEQRQLQQQSMDGQRLQDVNPAGVSEHDSTSGSSPATVDDHRDTSSVLESPPPQPPSNCDSCREYHQRLIEAQKRINELQRDLACRQQDVDALNSKIQRVTDVASRLLESCSDFDKLWMLHSKQVYSQIQNILNVLD